MSNVYMVTGKNCPNCDMLKMILNHMKLPKPEIVDVETPVGREIIKQTGARAIPVLANVGANADGETIVNRYIVGSHNSDEKVKAIYIEDKEIREAVLG